jgi:hypothetical protein
MAVTPAPGDTSTPASPPSTGAPASTTAVTGAPAPSNAVDWAYAILLGLGIDPTGKGNSVNALLAQMNLEDPSMTYLTGRSNPLASTNSTGTDPGNPSQSYATWTEGLAATVADLEANPAAVAALKSNASCQQYGAALAASNWEGGGAGKGDNPSYGMSVASRCSAPAVQNAESNSAFAQWVANNPNVGPDILSQVGGPIASAASSTVSDTAAIATFLGDLTNPTKLRRVGLFALGAAVFVIGLAGFISTTKEGQKIMSEGESAAAVAAVA